MSTMMILVAKFGATSLIPTKIVAEDYFGKPLRDFLKALKTGAIPCGNLDLNQAWDQGIPVAWLTEFIEMRRSMANGALQKSP
ncbi:hypothetical protein DEM26_18385 [Thioclava sp. NG1]|uniref:hypothetical protein n=1 Tax=Thioclava sp. NG1 TaxID=2182426 RepID=UPI000D619E66|nr:hypothetical protein [Thioclava sp. NG1]PWE48513.1 hypothetical protein DEM26_18385 [Thioclava sp. NG1]